jgi:hypothetical protein
MNISGSQRAGVDGKMMIGEEKLMKRFLFGQVEPSKHGLDYLRR